MRKFKVTKRWPGGPEVGTILSNYDVYANFYSAYGSVERSWHIDELTAEYTEEIKEPESVWYLENNGVVYESKGDSGVPSWLLFRTKESAEKFAKALKESYGINPRVATFGTADEIINMTDALNDRVK